MTAIRRVLWALAALLIASAACFTALAVTPDDYDPQNPANLENDHLYAESAFLIDMDTQEILLSKNSRVRMYPASTTKIMTLLLALESGIPLDQQVTIPAEAGNVPAGSSVIGIKPGDVMTWRDLLYGFMLKSGNDGSNAIAMLTTGSIPSFVDRMNQRAQELGCEGTHFTNAHGYHDQEHYTTAQDLFRISQYAMQNETFRQIVGTARQQITITRGGKTASGDAENRNSLLLPDSKYYYPGATGIKTGHHSQAGWCVVASAEREGVRLMAVVLNCATEDRKWQDAKKLLDYGFSQYAAYSMTELLNRMQNEICAVSIDNASEDDINNGNMLLRYGQIVNGDVTRMIHRNSEAAMQLATANIHESLNIQWNRELVAPVTAGEELGRVSFNAPDGSVVTAQLLASRDVEARPEPTPTPTPEPTPVPTVRPSADEGRENEAPERASAPAKTALVLVIAALLLLLVVLLAVHASRARKRREAARRRARRRRMAAARPSHGQAGRSGKSAARKQPSAPQKRARQDIGKRR